MNNVEDLKKQHFINYKSAVMEIINNNTESLFEEDIKLLFKTPPLDSMDLLKTKIISLAKTEDNIIDNEQLNKILDEYRYDIYILIDKFKENRKKLLFDVLDKYELGKDDVIKFNKKDFSEFDKNTKKDLKEGMTKSFSKNIIKNVHLLFTNKKTELTSFIDQLTKYYEKHYLKQIIENYDFKALVKNTILINGVKEQGERYSFTLENSHLFND